MALFGILLEVWQEGPGPGDPRTRNLPLMGSVWNMWGIIFIYILMVYYIGPKIMERYPEPLDTYDYLVWHNLFLVLTNGAFGLALLICMFEAKYNIFCEPVSDSGVDDVVAYMLYALFLLKLFELIDALTLVCKKMEPPFILVFHHTTIVAMVWVGVKYGPGGSAVFPTLLNSWVHVLIYVHFKYSRQFMSSYQARRIFVMIYFVQFLLVTFVSATVLYYQCGYPEWIAFLTVIYNLVLMVVYFRTMWTLWCGSWVTGSRPADFTSSSSDDDEGDGDNNASFASQPPAGATEKKSSKLVVVKHVTTQTAEQDKKLD